MIEAEEIEKAFSSPRGALPSRGPQGDLFRQSPAEMIKARDQDDNGKLGRGTAHAHTTVSAHRPGRRWPTDGRGTGRRIPYPLTHESSTCATAALGPSLPCQYRYV